MQYRALCSAPSGHRGHAVDLRARSSARFSEIDESDGNLDEVTQIAETIQSSSGKILAARAARTRGDLKAGNPARGQSR